MKNIKMQFIDNRKKFIIISVLLFILIVISIIVFKQLYVYGNIVTEWGTIDNVTPKDFDYFIQSEDREAAFYKLGEKYGISPTESSRKPLK